MRRCIRLPVLRALGALGALAAAPWLAGVAIDHGAARAGEPPPRVPMSAVSAATLFVQRCARCHDEPGTGTTQRGKMPRLPDFTSPRWQQQRSDAQLVVSILEGKGTHRPAFAGRLSRADARLLVRHIRACAPQETAGASEPALPDFHERFRQLQEEFERLHMQFRDLAGAAK